MDLSKANKQPITKTTSMKTSSKRKQKTKHGVQLQSSATSTDCLPTEIVAEILACLAASSPVDLLRCKRSCKALNEISEEKHVLQKVSLESLVYQRSWKIQVKSGSYVEKCLESNNPEAFLHLGMKQYFSKHKLEEGQRNIEKAAKQRNHTAAYVLSLIYLCSSETECMNKGVTLMLNTMRAIGGKGIIECREKLRDIMNSMWKTTLDILENKPKIQCTKQDHHKLANVNPWIRTDYYYDHGEDLLNCGSCKCARELDFFNWLMSS